MGTLSADPGRLCGRDHGRRAADVDITVTVRLCDRLRDLSQGRHVDDGLDTGLDEDVAERLLVANVAAHERRACRDGCRVPARQVVVHRHVIAARRQSRRDDASDVARSA
jgi:hypothetical protein